ncbi:hypothetical protein EVA_19028 [gut metagenome]|uniref:Uncharacterized protein n=1 Tax=gut metagenome TaxID=749906 RepID=J9FD64_9ZZZZ
MSKASFFLFFLPFLYILFVIIHTLLITNRKSKFFMLIDEI